MGEKSSLTPFLSWEAYGLSPQLLVQSLAPCPVFGDHFKKALNSYSLEHSINEIVGFGIGSALFGGGAQILNKSAIKPRGGVAGGGKSGPYTSYSRRHLGEVGKGLGRLSISTVAKRAGIIGAGIGAWMLHFNALKIYIECLSK